jgi:AcrR family transcriptional regulator
MRSSRHSGSGAGKSAKSPTEAAGVEDARRRRGAKNRRRLVATALDLVYRRGYHRSTLADIAQEAGIPPGNVFYYYKTKAALGRALVAERSREYGAERARWDGLPDPRQRLRAFVDMSLANRADLARSGCPIGSLCSELQKDGAEPGQAAAALFTDFLTWIARQFAALGKPACEASELAIHLLAVLEGATLLTHSLGTPAFIEAEACRLKRWLETI